jgi:hypothetical protein
VSWVDYVLVVLPALVGSAVLCFYLYAEDPLTFRRVLLINTICGTVSGFFISRATFKDTYLWVHGLLAFGVGLTLRGVLKLGKWMGRYDRSE